MRTKIFLFLCYIPICRTVLCSERMSSNYLVNSMIDNKINQKFFNRITFLAIVTYVQLHTILGGYAFFHLLSVTVVLTILKFYEYDTYKVISFLELSPKPFVSPDSFILLCGELLSVLCELHQLFLMALQPALGDFLLPIHLLRGLCRNLVFFLLSGSLPCSYNYIGSLNSSFGFLNSVSLWAVQVLPFGAAV